MIATTSTPAKEELVKKLGADHVINYKTDVTWGETARKLTGGIGVDHIIEVGGPGTLQQSLNCIKFEGIISIIGFLAPGASIPSVLDTLSKICVVRGVYVGSRTMLEDMVKAIEANNIHPVVDKSSFTLDEVKDAYNYMVSANPLFAFDFCLIS